MENMYSGSLHNHTEYSNIRIRDSINRIEDMLNYAEELGHKVIGFTDHETVSSWIKIEKAAKKHPDLKIIRGNEIYLVRNGLNADNFVKDVDRYYHFILLAKDLVGAKQIFEISTRAWKRSYMARGMRRVPTYYQDLVDIIGANPGHVIGSTACFKAGTQVETKDGWKNIEDIQSGDYVINRFGEWEKVIEPTSMMTHQYGYSIELTGNEHPIICTDNHEFLVITNNSKNPKWVQAKDLNLTPRSNSKHIGLEPVNYTYIQSPIIYRSEWDNSYLPESQFSHRNIRLPDEIEITPELMRLFGLFLGDGCISLKSNPRISFTFNEVEFDNYMDSFINIASNQLNISWNINKRPENHRVDITSSSADLINLFHYLFGDVKADTKYIPSRLRVSKELDYELVFGYLLADGYFRTRDNNGKCDGYTTGEFTSASISKQLSYDLYNILNQINITASIMFSKKHIDSNGTNHKNAWYVSGANKFLGEINKLTNYSHNDVVEIFNAAVKAKEKDFILIDNIKYRKIRFKSAKKIELNEIVYCLNNTTHSFKCENIIVHNCLGGALPTQILRGTSDTKLNAWIGQMINIFGKDDFYLEMQPSKNKEQIIVNKKLLEFANKWGLNFIITTDSHYLKSEDRVIHKAYLNAQNGDREIDDFYATTYMMGTEELESYMKYSFDDVDVMHAAYKSISDIADKCEEFSLSKALKIPELLWRTHYPNKLDYGIYVKKMPTLEKFYNSDYKSDKELVWAVIDGIKAHDDLQNEEAYAALEDNLQRTWESSEVNKARWSAYYLNLQRNIDECWNAGTIVGPARGSGGGFVLLYCLDVIQMNCLREPTPMFPWRFLNPQRVSVLDIDTDIEGGKRAQVLQHLRNVYGEDRVANVATFRTEKSKSAVLTAARGLGIDVDIAQYIASLIPADRGQLRSLDQCMNGDEENDWAPIKQFQIEMKENYPELWNVARGIEGLICGSGIHAGGVIFVDEPFTESTGLMRAPDGTICTAFELHDAEEASLIKIDLLSVEAMDKIHNCIDLLCEYGYAERKSTLRETYESIVGVYNLERDDPAMWQMVLEHKIGSLFQMEKQSGINGIAIAKPQHIDELAVLNSVIRLMAPEKGAEQPLDMWARYRQDITTWYDEMRAYGLNEEQIEWLAHHNAIHDGICESQEGLMSLVQEERLGANDLTFADKCRKAIAKKQGKLFEECEAFYFKNAEEKGCDMRLAHYVWDVVFKPQRGYSFNASHTHAYSLVALQEMNLAFKYPIMFWNCACLISDAGGNEEEEPDEEVIEEIKGEEPYYEEMEEFSEEEDEEESSYDEDDSESGFPATIVVTKEGKKKKKVKATNYGKIASAIGKIKATGVMVSAPDINESGFTFSPDIEHNCIRYGLSGITRIGNDLIKAIMSNRPYNNINDFLSKVKITKPQMINLIKSGAFDAFGQREAIMHQYVNLISDIKKRITLQNMKMLIEFGLIPDEFDLVRRTYNFNKYIKKLKEDATYYALDSIGFSFYERNFDVDKLVSSDSSESGFKIKQVVWDTIYQGQMDKIRPYIKKNHDELLRAVNERLTSDIWNKYCLGNISKWEMEATSCYIHEHELLNVDHDDYGWDIFGELPTEPQIEKYIPIKGKMIPILRLSRIAGTVLDRDKSKKTVTLLTIDGVITVKIYGGVFAQYDKQISEKGADGHKHVLRKSEFSRGNKIIVTGVRDGDNEFRAKTYSKTPFHLIETISSITNGVVAIENRQDLNLG